MNTVYIQGIFSNIYTLSLCCFVVGLLGCNTTWTCRYVTSVSEMEAVCSSRMLVYTYKSAQCYSTEDQHHQCYDHKNKLDILPEMNKEIENCNIANNRAYSIRYFFKFWRIQMKQIFLLMFLHRIWNVFRILIKSERCVWKHLPFCSLVGHYHIEKR
jgi:hypothetical protein